MDPSQNPPEKWYRFSDKYLPLILENQVELYSLNFHHMQFDQLFFSNIKQWYTDGIQLQDCHSYLLFDHLDRLIGFYLYQKNENTIYLMQMFVAKAFRGKGYGSLLLQHYENEGKLQGAVSSFLHASSINQQAVSFYRRRNYVIIDEEKDEDESPRFLMFKNLLKV